MTLGLLLTGLPGCAPPLELKSVPPGVRGTAPGRMDTTGTPPQLPVVQLRYFRYSPSVSVVAWDPEDIGYGLRSWFRRDGTLIEDHRIYVRAYYDPAVRSFPRAMTPHQPLLMVGTSVDIYACYFGDVCSPRVTFGARIPDAVLRGASGSLPVTFYAYGGRELRLSLGGELIQTYLATVDSLTMALRARRLEISGKR